MRLDWLEDLLAIVDEGTLSKAASSRFLTQPAFSRRIRSIEEHIGVELVERASRPVCLKPFVLEQSEAMRDLSNRLRLLERLLKREDAERRQEVILASPHGIITYVASEIIRKRMPSDLSFRLRTADREECYAMLMTRQADMALVHQTSQDKFAASDNLLEEILLDTEKLVPIFSKARFPDLQNMMLRNELPIVSYPRSVFFGRLLEKAVIPNINAAYVIQRRAETTLTMAALELGLSGVGVSWVPASLARRELERGTLVDLSESLPWSMLELASFRFGLRKIRSKAAELAWNVLVKVPII